MASLQTATAALVIVLCYLIITRITKRGTYPPGPKKLPILGNILDVPTEVNWDMLTSWKEKYGESRIVYPVDVS